MGRLVLILVIALFAEPAFSQKGDVKSGTIRVVKKKYSVRRIYPVDVNQGWFSNGTGQRLVVANLYGRYGFYVMSTAELLAQRKIFVNSSEYEVISFDLSCRVSGLEIVESSEGNQFSENQKKLAGHLRQGTKLFIENIKCKNSEGVIKDLGSITVKIPSGVVVGGRIKDGHDPFLIASVSGIYGLGVLRIKKSDLLNAKGIDLADPSSKIVGFSLHCEYNGVTFVEHSTSDLFTPKMKEILSKVRTGGKVKLLMIRYSNETGSIRTYGNLNFAVVK